MGLNCAHMAKDSLILINSNKKTHLMHLPSYTSPANNIIRMAAGVDTVTRCRKEVSVESCRCRQSRTCGRDDDIAISGLIANRTACTS